MDPRLLRLFEQGDGDDQVAAILRLTDAAQPPPAEVRPVVRFGNILTVRLRRADIPRIHDLPEIVSMKPAAPLLREAMVDVADGGMQADTRDIRRSPDQQATGRGVVVGIVDWGFDFAHPDLRHPDGRSRLLALWDQGRAPGPDSPAPYGYGVVHTKAAIDAALAGTQPYDALGYHPAASDLDGGGTHGTHVAGIAVGNGRSGGPSGIAPDANIVCVELTTLDPRDPDLADAASVLEAIDFISNVAGPRPWVVNLSMGQCGDQHDGTTLLEQGLDAALAGTPGRAIVQSTGNYFQSRQHSSGRLRTGERRTVTWQVPASDDTNELELWYPGSDAITVLVRGPDGSEAGRAALGERALVYVGNQRCGVIHNRRRDPNTLDNHLVLWLDPQAPAGDWQLTFIGSDVVDGSYHLWIQRGDGGDGQASFRPADANPFFTTNSICNGRRTIAVGAYDARAATRHVAAFSSAGPTRDGRPKPDLVAPGVNILSARSTPANASPGSGGLVRMTGTSMAAPHVTGTVALMFEAAVVPLSSEQTRALLTASTQPSGVHSRQAIRYGNGYLDTDAAVALARGHAINPYGENRRFPEMTLQPIASATNGTAADDGADPLATADTLIGMGGHFAASPIALLTRVLSGFADPDALDLAAASGLLDPAMLFDAFTCNRPFAMRPLLDQLFAVVAYPKQRLAPQPQPGDLLLRRGLGEPGIGHAAFIDEPGAGSLQETRWRGLQPETWRAGIYAPVVEAGSHPHRRPHRFARRVADAWGYLPADTLILRPRLARRPALAEKTGAATPAAPVTPPAEVAGWPLGVDLYYLNFYKGAPITAAGFANLKSLGKVFAILKSSQGTASDIRFADYYQRAADAGLIRGSYHFFANKLAPSGVWGGTVSQQADTVLALVPRLGPGDLAPALDLEDEPRNPAGGKDPKGRYPLDQGILKSQSGYNYRHSQAGRNAVVADVQEFLNRVETALGRTPMIYTSVMWMDGDMMQNPTDLSTYPVWTVNHGRTAHLVDISIGGWGTSWDFVQYAEDGGNYFGMPSYAEPGVGIPGCDFDAYRGTLAGLRGLADLGRPAAGMTSAASYVVHYEADDSLHLRSGPSWTDHNLSGAELFGTASDPDMIVTSASVFLYYRQGGHVMEASNPHVIWHADAIAAAATAPFHNPRAVTDGTTRHVAYWGSDDDWHLLSWNRAWTGINGVLTLAGVKTAAGGSASGQPVPYLAGAVVHLVGRAGADGHLHDVWQEGGTWHHDDLTALAHPTVPAATYAPAACITGSATLIVFRAVGGDLWAISRTDNSATNLTQATGAAGAVGSPACVTLKGTEPHVIFRATDRLVHEMWLESGHWHVQPICTDAAAADPAAATDGTSIVVAIRAADNALHVARFDGGRWTCTATPAMSDGLDGLSGDGMLA